jgi:hypothetical protein
MEDYPPEVAAAADAARQAAYVTMTEAAEVVLAATQVASQTAAQLVTNSLDPRTSW